MALYNNAFTRADTAVGAGLGSVPSGPAWEVVSGSWRILTNRAFSDTAASSSPIVVIPGGSGDCNISASVSSVGGDALYARVLNATNWIRARIRHYQVTSSYQYYNTEYEYQQMYFHDSSVHNNSQDNVGVWSPAEVFLYSYDQNSFPLQTSVYHDQYQGTTPDVYKGAHTHNYVKNGGPTQTGATRQTGPFTATQTDQYYEVILEKNVAGTVTALSTVGISAPSSLRLRAVGSSVQVFVSGSATASINASESANATVARHGIGRGPSDLTGSALDNFSLDSPSNPTVTAPNGGESWDQSHTITWLAPSPLPAGVNYDVDLTKDGGVTWNRMVSGTAANSLTYNFATEPQVSNARVRVRAIDSAGITSNWDESNANFSIAHPFTTPTSVTPSNGSTLTTDVPTLGATMVSNGQPQKIEWQIAGDAAFTVNLRTVTQPDSELKTSGTQSFVTPNANALFQGTWHLRARGVGSGGINASPWSATNILTVTHPPTSIGHAPTGGVVINYGTGQITMSTTFSDTSPVDTMTAGQVILERNDNGVLVSDSGKLARTGPTFSYQSPIIGTALRDIPLRWKVHLWDRDDVVGPYSSFHLFTTSDLPVITITSPATGSQLSSGQPSVVWTFSATNARTQVDRRVFFTRTSDNFIVHDTGFVPNTTFAYTPPSVVLENLKNYTVTVEVRDSSGLTGTDTNSFSTSYAKPAEKSAFTVDASGFDNFGYVLISYNDAINKDPDWYAWRVYRRLLGTVTWELLEESRTTQTAYSYKDYLATSGNAYQYSVSQVVLRFSELIESNLNLTTVTPISSFYWIIFADSPTDSFKIENVTGDDPTEEYEQEEIMLIGRGRHVEYGTRYGWRSEITAQIFGDENKTARERWLQLREMKSRLTSFYLRNPFGDLWLVAAGDIAFGRTPGHARNEYGTITIPYAEVAP